MSNVRDQWKREKHWMNGDIEIIYKSNADRERIDRLFRRIEHLEQRCGTRDQCGESISFDKMEISALRYVLKELAMHRRNNQTLPATPKERE